MPDSKNGLAYYNAALNYERKKFYSPGPAANVIKNLTAVSYAFS